MTTQNEFHIWEGVYGSFEQAPAVGPGFSGSAYSSRALDAAREALGAVRSGTPMRQVLTQRTVVLPPVVACTLQHAPSVSVLDFGGGLGIGYLTLLESIPGVAERLEYHIVEIPAVCETGRQLFASVPRLTFHEHLPEPRHARAFTIVYSSSALQYVPDWRNLLAKLAGYGPEVLLLSDVFAGDIPTFCSLQNYYESRIPQWFLNLRDLTDMLATAGYTFQMKTRASVKLLDRDGALPMENFDPPYRLSETLHLLFQPEPRERIPRG